MPRSTAPTTKTAAVKRAARKSVVAKKVETTKRVGKGSRTPLPGEEGHPLKQRLKPTETPGVFENEMGVRTDYRGLALAILNIRTHSEDQERSVLGRLAASPAEVMKVAAMDRSLPLPFRVEAAKSAAPYFDRKMPQALDGGADPANPTGPGLPIRVEDLRKLNNEELALYKACVEKMAAP